MRRRAQEETLGYQSLAARLEGSTKPFVAVVIKDVAGQEYLFQRPYMIQDGIDLLYAIYWKTV